MNRAKVTLSLIFLAGLMTLPVTGCSRQKEGERCDLDNADDDCDQGGEDLICTDAGKLRGGKDDGGVSRCCPEDLNDYSDSRCAPKQGGVGDGMGGMGGDTGSGGTGSGGTGTGGGDTVGLKDEGEACNYTSDCLLNLICGPAAKCQKECREDRDCVDGKDCNETTNVCE